MIAILSLLLIVIFSVLITRFATIALIHTGLTRETARFQARSALTGAGFTTGESEKVVNHPVRRRIILLLMLLGNAGVVTAVSSLILTFVHQSTTEMLALKIAALITGLVVLWALATSSWVDRHLSRMIDRALERYSDLKTRDLASLLHLAKNYRIVELKIEEQNWLAGLSLAETKLRNEGIIVLGIITKDDTYLGTPKGSERIQAGDTLLLYGRDTALVRLDRRDKTTKGEQEHRQAVAEQKHTEREEKLEAAESRRSQA